MCTLLTDSGCWKHFYCLIRNCKHHFWLLLAFLYHFTSTITRFQNFLFITFVNESRKHNFHTVFLFSISETIFFSGFLMLLLLSSSSPSPSLSLTSVLILQWCTVMPMAHILFVVIPDHHQLECRTFAVYT